MGEEDQMNQGNKIDSQPKRPWLKEVLIAVVLLIVLIVIVGYFFRNDIIERPLLSLLVLFAWLGAFVGTKIHGG